MVELRNKIEKFLEITIQKRVIKNADLIQFKISMSKSKNSIYVTLYTENEIDTFKSTLRISDHNTERKNLRNNNMVIQYPRRKKTYEAIKRKLTKMMRELLIKRLTLTTKVLQGEDIGSRNKTKDKT